MAIHTLSRNRRYALNDTTAAGLGPEAYSGLLFWFDAADRSTLFTTAVGGDLATDSGLVGAWRDKGTLQKDATSSGTNRPTLVANYLNGYSVLQFTAASATILSTTNQLPGSAAMTTFVVCRASAVSSYNSILRWQEIDSGYYVHGFWSSPTSRLLSSVDTAAAYGANPGVDMGLVADAWNISVATRTRNVASTGLISYRNGTLISNATSNDTAFPARTLAIGRPGYTTAEGYNGYIAEAFGYDYVASGDMRQRLTSYLAAKWNISL